jgi:hypothetical protein
MEVKNMKYLKIFLTIIVYLILALLAIACSVIALTQMSIMWLGAAIVIIALAVAFMCWAFDNI